MANLIFHNPEFRSDLLWWLDPVNAASADWTRETAPGVALPLSAIAAGKVHPKAVLSAKPWAYYDQGSGNHGVIACTPGLTYNSSFYIYIPVNFVSAGGLKLGVWFQKTDYTFIQHSTPGAALLLANGGFVRYNQDHVAPALAAWALPEIQVVSANIGDDFFFTCAQLTLGAGVLPYDNGQPIGGVWPRFW